MLGRTRLGKLFNSWDMERIEKRLRRRMRYIYRIDLDKPERRKKRQKW